MTADPWQTLGAKLPGEDEENDRIDIAGFADQYNPDLDGEVLEEAPTGEVPPPRFVATEAESPLGADEEADLADAHPEVQKTRQPAQSPPPSVAPVSMPPVRPPVPKVAAPVAPVRSAQGAQAPQKSTPLPEADDRDLVGEAEGEQERGPGVSGPRVTEPTTAVARRARWPLVAALAGGVALLGGVGTVAFLKSATPAYRPMVHTLPAPPPGATNTRPLPHQPTAPAMPHGAPGAPVGPGAPPSSTSPAPAVAALAMPGSGPRGVYSAQNDTTVLPSTVATGSVSVPLASAVTPSPTPASSHTVASQLARLERSFQGIKFLVGQITRKESALATAIQKEQTTSLRDAAVIARQGREIAHLTWLVHHAPRITVRPLAPPKPKPKPKPLVPPVQLVGIIGHAAWIEVPNGALVRIFRGNPIPGTPKLSVRSIQANPPLLILSNGVHLREAGP